MKANLFVITAMCLLLFACRGSSRTDDTVDMVLEEISSSGYGKETTSHDFWIDGYQEIDSSSDYLVFPLWLGTVGQEKRSIKSMRKRNVPQNAYWNLLFYNPMTLEKHLLYEEKAVILTYSPFSAPKNPVADNLIFYKIIRNDFNADGELDLKDPVQLYVSDKNGKNFRSLTPENMDLVGWKIYRNSPVLLAELSEDANGDSLFTAKDPKQYYRVDLSGGNLGVPAFSPGYLDQLENQLKTFFPPPAKDE